MKALVDCNSFYAACERLFCPRLHGKPVVVLSNNDGCIVSRSDEAKALGIQMAGPYYQHKQEIEQHKVAVFSSNYHLYGDLSRRVMETLRTLAPNVEVYSVDESFLDLDGIDPKQLEAYGRFVKYQTELWTGIPVSIGIAPTKVLTKVANKLAKKDKAGSGGVVLLQNAEEQMMALKKTAVEDIWGVGISGSKKLRLYNINTAWDLRNMSENWAKKNLGGVVGVRLIRELRGEPCIEMKKQLEQKKMIATTRMFGKAVFDLTSLKEAVATYTSRAAEKLRRQHAAANTISVFLVSNNPNPTYEYSPRSRSLYASLPSASSLTRILIAHALPLVESLFVPGNKYVKAGVILSGIIPDDSIQYNLFENPTSSREKELMQVLDNINFGMRSDMLKFASAGIKNNWKMRQELRSRRFSSRWDELPDVR